MNNDNFTNNDYYDDSFDDINIVNEKISDIKFDDCIFENCNFNKSIISHCKFVECTFINCDLSLLNVIHSVFNDVKIKNCKAIGINWYKADDNNFELSFHDSNITMSSFSQRDLKHISIIDCIAHDVDCKIFSADTGIDTSIAHRIEQITSILPDKMDFFLLNCIAHDVDFTNANLQNANFKNTDLKGSIFSQSNLKNTDLTYAKNYMIDPNANYLKDTKVSMIEATSFLQFLGLKIRK